MAERRTVILWDIDQTLVRTGGAGSAAMDLAFAELYGIEDAFARVEFTGRTDYAIFFDGLDFAGLDKSNFQSQLVAFRDAYVRHLAALLPERQGAILPGVVELISRLKAAKAAQGIATGNFRRGAELKLGHFGLDRRLKGGGYGDHTAVRGEVVAEAAASVAAVHGLNGRADVTVIGDTPLDIEAARSNGFRSLAVATGRFSVDELGAAGADLVFDDLSDVDQVLDKLSAA
jgi:phosphoglycolate phosphatase